MGRHKHEYTDIEKTQLMGELYCSACCNNFFKENVSKSKLTQEFDNHCKTKKHKINVEKYRFNLDVSGDSNSKIEPFTDNLNDDNLTSISSMLSNKSLTMLYKLDEKCSSNTANYYKIKSDQQMMLEDNNYLKTKLNKHEGLVNKLLKQMEEKKEINKKVSFKDDSGDSVKSDDSKTFRLKLCQLVLEQYTILYENKEYITNNDVFKKLTDITLEFVKLNKEYVD
jgi:hypothetical protein